MDYKPTLTIKASDYPGVALGIDDTGELAVKFTVVGVNRQSDTTPMGLNTEPDDISYTLEYSTDKISVDKVSLQKATERASKDLYVKTQTTPAP